MSPTALRLAIAHALSISFAGAAGAATINVTTDAPDVNADAECSLAEAIVNANNNDQTHAECAAGDNASLIDLDGDGVGETSGDVISLVGVTPSQTITLTAALPTISDPVAIVGNAVTLERDAAASAMRLLDIAGGANIDELTLTGGSVTGNGGAIRGAGPMVISNAVLSGNSATGDGGALYVYDGDATLTDVTVTNNSAGGDGGGVAVNGYYYGDATLTDVTVTGNTAGGDGGGVAVNGYYSGDATLTDVTVTNNSAGGDGGGVALRADSYYGYYYLGRLVATDVTFTGNTAANQGGGVHLVGDGDFDGGTFSMNSASSGGGIALGRGRFGPNIVSQGGGAYLAGDGVVNGDTSSMNSASSGGGIALDGRGLSAKGILVDDPVQITGTQFTNNYASYTGGAIHVFGASLEITSATLTGNIVSSGGPQQRKGFFSIYGCGGGLAADYGATVRADSLVVSNNVAGLGGGLCALPFANLQLEGGTVSGNFAEFGGGIGTFSSNLRLEGTTVSGNYAAFGGGVGDVIYSPFYGIQGLTEFVNATVDGNYAYYFGGGAAVTGQVRVSGTSFSGNTADSGGGLFSVADLLEIDDSVISANTSGYAGGMVLGGSSSIIRNTTISDNTADTGYGGGVLAAYGNVAISNTLISGNSANTRGGAVRIDSYAALQMNQVTLSGNQGSGDGATLAATNTSGPSASNMQAALRQIRPAGVKGSSVDAGQVTIVQSTIQSDVVGDAALLVDNDMTITLTRTIVDAPAGITCQAGATGTLTADAANLASDGACDGATESTMISLGPLADNGGPTLSHLPLPGSLAVDLALSDEVCDGLTTDQRGFDRTVDADNDGVAQCDIGAVEVQNTPVVAQADSLTVFEDTVFNLAADGLLANDIDAAGDEDAPLAVATVEGHASQVGMPLPVAPGGIVTINADGSAVFDPNGEFETLRSGATSIVNVASEVTDGFAQAASTATFTVQGANDAPSAFDQAFSSNDKAGVGDAVGTVVATDIDAGDTLSFAITGGNTSNAFTIDPNSGAIMVANATALDASVNPTFNLTVQVTDNGSPPLAATPAVTISVVPVDDDPVANDDTRMAVLEDSGTLPIPIADLLANDSPGDMDDTDSLTIVDVGNVVGGLVVLNGNNYDFTPDADFFGSASFDYTVEDQAGASDDAQVTIPVTGVNDAPSFDLSSDLAFNEGASGLQQVAGFASVLDFGPGESDTVQGFIVTESSDLVSGVAIDDAGNLSLVLSGDPGMADIEVALQDTGGTANGGVDTSATQTFNLFVGSGVDLEITKDDGSPTWLGGELKDYLITVRNIGPSDAIGPRVTDVLPAALVDASWECVALGNAACAANGVGDVDELVNIPAGDSLIYLLSATVARDFEGPLLVNTATVTEPSGTTENDPGDNTATDSNIPDELFGSSFENGAPTLAFAAKSARLDRDAVARALDPNQPLRPVLVMRAVGTDDLALVLAHARERQGHLELRLSRFENGTWQIGEWHLLAADPTLVW